MIEVPTSQIGYEKSSRTRQARKGLETMSPADGTVSTAAPTAPIAICGIGAWIAPPKRLEGPGAPGVVGRDNAFVDAVNIFRAENSEGRVDVARAVDSTATLMFIYDLAPGESSSPYHYEYDEEWLLVVDGTIVVRMPEGEQSLGPGDVVCFPPGAAGAHKVMNRSDAPARTLMFSSSRMPAVSVYPDSDTIGVWPGNEADDLVFERRTAVPWAHGEEGWQRAT
jgi:uncharacterized cupin superfamily protein